MEKQKLIDNLEQFGYTYTEYEDRIEVQLTKSFFVTVSFEEGKIQMKDKFKGWNILNGLLKLSFRQTFLYFSISVMILVFYFYISLSLFRFGIGDMNFNLFLLGVVILMFLYLFFAFFYYYIKYISFTQLVQIWLKK